MKIARLHYISQQTEQYTHFDAIREALDAGCEWIQLRVKNTTTQQLLPVAEKVKQLCAAYNARLIVNDYPAVAMAVEAYGVHLGLADMPVAQARQLVGRQMIIGGTANCFEDVQLRVKEGADYIGLGPLRFTRTKEKLSPLLGLDGYTAILQQMQAAGMDIPVIAIGGIDVDDVTPLLAAGVHGVAVSGTILHAPDKKNIVTALYNRLEKVYS